MQLPQVKEERDLLLKKIYDYCVKVNWQKTKLDEMARELGTTRTNLRKLAKKYAKETLTVENYQKLIEQVDEIIKLISKKIVAPIPKSNHNEPIVSIKRKPIAIANQPKTLSTLSKIRL